MHHEAWHRAWHTGNTQRRLSSLLSLHHPSFVSGSLCAGPSDKLGTQWPRDPGSQGPRDPVINSKNRGSSRNSQSDEEPWQQTAFKSKKKKTKNVLMEERTRYSGSTREIQREHSGRSMGPSGRSSRSRQSLRGGLPRSKFLPGKSR